MNDEANPFGELPADWRFVQLRDITSKIGSGATPTGGQNSYLPSRRNFALVRSQNVLTATSTRMAWLSLPMNRPSRCGAHSFSRVMSCLILPATA